MYHSAPLNFCTAFLAEGSTCVILEKFDAESALRAIEEHKVTHSQWVPTMFIRLLQLPEHTRLKYDLSSLNCVIHAAAPCPVEIKQQMLDWWGPIIWEYYGGSEGNGLTVINSEEWLLQKGSVGKAKIGRIRICGDDGEELPVGETGLIYFSDGPSFEYNNDRIKTQESRNQYDWSTMGDIGHINQDDYLFITDRKANMIISGGVNIYPQEAENRLLSHPEIRDAAVIGVPNSDFGEEVKGIVQLIDSQKAGEVLAQELIEYCWESVSKIKSSGKSHAHKIQAAVAMEQRAKEMGKTSQAGVYRAYINKMKKIKVTNYKIPSDISSSAFFIVLTALANDSKLKIENVNFLKY